MFNPFHPFTPAILDKFIAVNKTFFVRQQFNRGYLSNQPDIKASFLFSQYAELPAAQQHLGAISYDASARLYDYSNPVDRSKLLIATTPPKGYTTFCNIFENNWENLIPPEFKIKLKHYIEHTLKWNPSRSDNVNFTIFMHYGKVFGRIKYRKQEVRVQLEDIEQTNL